MKVQSLEPILRQHAFFKGFGEEDIQLVTGCAKNVRFDSGIVIARQGEPADQFYLIREGRIGIGIPSPRGGSLTIETLDENEIVGWSWLIPPYEWQFDVTAMQSVRALSIDGKCLRGKCEQDPRLGYELMKRFSKTMVERLRATRLQLLDIYGNSKPAP